MSGSQMRSQGILIRCSPPKSAGFHVSNSSRHSWNPSIYNIIRWVAWTMGQMNCRPSVLYTQPDGTLFFLIFAPVKRHIKNPSIYNIIRWVAWMMGEMNRGLSVWCSKYYFFKILFIDLGHSKLFIFIFVIL